MNSMQQMLWVCSKHVEACAKPKTPGNFPSVCSQEFGDYGAQHGPTSPWTMTFHLSCLGVEDWHYFIIWTRVIAQNL